MSSHFGIQTLASPGSQSLEPRWGVTTAEPPPRQFARSWGGRMVTFKHRAEGKGASLKGLSC